MDPSQVWALGGQCVALNYQTECVEMHLNDSKFYENAQCGYLEKPLYMTNNASEVITVKRPKVRLKLHIISGQMLPKPDNDLKGEV